MKMSDILNRSSLPGNLYSWLVLLVLMEENEGGGGGGPKAFGHFCCWGILKKMTKMKFEYRALRRGMG